MNIKELHIGKIVQGYVLAHNINTAELARQIGKSKQNLYDLYKRSDVEVKLLLTLSEALGHDFFEDIRPTKKDVALDEVFDTLKNMVKENMK